MVNLIIDIGNSVAKIAVFDSGELVEVVHASNTTLEGLPEILEKYVFDKAIVASVVHLTEELAKELNRIPVPCLMLTGSTPVPVTNLYQTPETLGYDRLAAAIGANGLYPGNNILVIDAGTAITYEFIDAEGNYHGGNISPGIQIRLKSLNNYTAKLPLVNKEGEVLQLGKNTETAIRSGVINGIKYETEGYIRDLKSKYPDLLVFLTGGEEISFDTKLKSIIFADKFLVLKGLNRILDYNNDQI